jgi:hypothetical protein
VAQKDREGLIGQQSWAHAPISSIRERGLPRLSASTSRGMRADGEWLGAVDEAETDWQAN